MNGGAKPPLVSWPSAAASPHRLFRLRQTSRWGFSFFLILATPKARMEREPGAWPAHSQRHLPGPPWTEMTRGRTRLSLGKTSDAG